MAQHWTDANIPDLTGRTALVTGANTGLGFNEALQLAKRGAHVLVAARNQQKGQAAVDRLRTQVPAESVELVALDLADLDSVRKLSSELVARLPHLDLLINNAGVMAVPKRETTKQGFELQFGTNHLGHFALTGLLLPLLLAKPGSRVVTLSSGMHKMGTLNLDDLQSEQKYGPNSAYSASKLANAVFTVELNRRLEAAKTGVLSVGAHPGFSSTDLQYSGPRLGGTSLYARLIGIFTPILAQSAAQGALPVLRAAVDPQVSGGDYYGPHALGEWRGYPIKVPYIKTAYSERLGKALWDASVELTSVTYPELSAVS